MIGLYPELLPIYEKEMFNKNKYYENVFEAGGSFEVNKK